MTMAIRTKTLGIAAALSLAALGTVTTPNAARADEQYFPLQSYRVGPYAAGGTGFFGGFIDYLNLINIRDGGVNSVKLTWEECETQYEVERGVECYERQKSHPAIAAWNPLSVGRRHWIHHTPSAQDDVVGLRAADREPLRLLLVAGVRHFDLLHGEAVFLSEH